VGRVGPLPLVSARNYAVEYVEGDFLPGMMTRVHRHPGAEAFYTVAGQTCLETPKGVLRQRADGPGIIVPGGTPMRLTASGTQPRFGFAAVLQDSSKPFSSAALDWKPRGLCRP
jgi:quercetin dioxygenase-like cupin family protein